MSVNFQSANYYPNYDYNPRKKVNKAGILGAGIGLATCAGLQYGGGELLKRNAEVILSKGADAASSNKKALTKIWDYLLECALGSANKTTVWKRTGIAGVVGATVVGLAAALKTAKNHLPKNN